LVAPRTEPQCHMAGAGQGCVEGLLTPGGPWQSCRIRLARGLAGRMPTLARLAPPTSPIALQRKAPAWLRRMQRF
jgi:hypothetical protein